jgi:DNA-directed RNA polymerase specialized sigma24 family protein
MRLGVNPIHKNSSSAVNNTIANVYKREHVRLRAILLRLLGVQHLLLVDDILQDTYVKALSNWQTIPNGEPENPAAWLTLTAKRAALDALRGQKVRQQYASMIENYPALASGRTAAGEVNEHLKAMTFEDTHWFNKATSVWCQHPNFIWKSYVEESSALSFYRLFSYWLIRLCCCECCFNCGRRYCNCGWRCY